MKKFLKIAANVLLMAGVSFLNLKAQAQCSKPLGVAANGLTIYETEPTQVVVNNALHSILFIHRAKPGLSGGDNGVYQYDLSTDNGATWLVNQGNLNPASAPSRTGRHPNISLHNPSGNTNPANASLVYAGSTVNTSTSVWNGNVTGTQKLDGVSASTEHYNQAGEFLSSATTQSALCKGANGVFWNVEPIYQAATGLNRVYGLRVFKGTFDGGDVNWTLHKTINENFFKWYKLYYVNDSASTYIGSKIAFDPTGQKGWILVMGRLANSTLSGNRYTPIFYKTTDGGNTWSSAIEVDLDAMPELNGTYSRPAMQFSDFDLSVDVNGNPHAVFGVVQMDSDETPISRDINLPPAVVDVTMNGSSFTARKLGFLVNLVQYSPSFSVQTENRFKISRSDDGTKMVFTYGELSDVKAILLDVPSQNYTCPILYSSKCAASYTSDMQLSKVSPNLLEVGGNYIVPMVIGVVAPGNSLSSSPLNFTYVDGFSFAPAEFLVAQGAASPTISASAQQVCMGGTVTLTASASNAYLWSTGETTQSIEVLGGNTYTVLDPSQNTCVRSSNIIHIQEFEPPYMFNPNSQWGDFPTDICGGVPITAMAINSNMDPLTVHWSTGFTGSEITISTPGKYWANSLENGCPTDTLFFNDIAPNPVITTNPEVTINPGEATTLTVSGADYFYEWNPFENISILDDFGSVVEVNPPATTEYVVVGQNMNGCKDTASVLVTVRPLLAPVISPGTGTYADPALVTITSNLPGARILYTTTGNTPVEGTGFTKEYTAPFTQIQTGTIRAMVLVNGMASPVAVANLTITNPGIAAAPLITPGTGSYGPSQTVSMTTATSGASIYYAINGNMPVVGTAFTKLYSGPFFLQNSATLRAIAVKAGILNSPATVAVITITSPSANTANPVISPGGGAFGTAQNVTITCATPGATIYYTTNGNNPRLDVPNSFTKTYSGPILITQTATVRAMAVAPGLVNSGIATALFTIGALRQAVAAESPDFELQTESKIQLYPNPTQGRLYIQLEEEREHVTIEIRNHLGQLVLSRSEDKLAQTTLDLAGWPSGIYFVQLSDPNRRQQFKVILTQ